MNIVGFNFTKILIEKNEVQGKEIKVNSGINLKQIEKYKGSTKSKENFLSIDWNYEVNYSEDLAKINFEGSVIVSLEEKKQKEVLSDWKKK